MRFTTLIATALTLLSLSSCAFTRQEADLGEVETITYHVDSNATIITAEFGKTYLLEGNIIARYPDFDLARTQARIVAADHLEQEAGTYDTIEIRGRDGHLHKTLLLTPDNKHELLRFRVNDRSYFINRAKTPGSIRITIPSHHIASL